MSKKMILPKAHLRNWIHEVHPAPYSTRTKKEVFEYWAEEGERMSKLRPDHANIEVLVEDWEKLMLDIAEVGKNPKDYTRESGYEKVANLLCDFQKKHGMKNTTNVRYASNHPVYRDSRCTNRTCDSWKICDC
tara:strand:+ start:1329 stop:1727 length:399 start_codon:yes stop_codon:yes gene_type:complete